MKQNLTLEDRIALAEAYRVYELLEDTEKEKIPPAFVGRLFDYGALDLVPPFDPTKTLKDFQLSERGKYIVLYMCSL